MAIVLLIEADDIRKFRNVASGVNEEKEIHSFILEAQELDIKPVLGNALYTNLLSNRTSTIYKALLDGGEYTYEAKVYSFMGLKTVIAYFTHSRYILNRNVQDTPFGAMVKGENEYGKATADKEIQRISIQSANSGQSFLDDVMVFLERNKTTYPLYESGDCSETNERPKRGFKFNKVG